MTFRGRQQLRAGRQAAERVVRDLGLPGEALEAAGGSLPGNFSSRSADVYSDGVRHPVLVRPPGAGWKHIMSAGFTGFTWVYGWQYAHGTAEIRANLSLIRRRNPTCRAREAGGSPSRSAVFRSRRRAFAFCGPGGSVVATFASRDWVLPRSQPGVAQESRPHHQQFRSDRFQS